VGISYFLLFIIYSIETTKKPEVSKKPRAYKEVVNNKNINFAKIVNALILVLAIL